MHGVSKIELLILSSLELHHRPASEVAANEPLTSSDLSSHERKSVESSTTHESRLLAEEKAPSSDPTFTVARSIWHSGHFDPCALRSGSSEPGVQPTRHTHLSTCLSVFLFGSPSALPLSLTVFLSYCRPRCRAESSVLVQNSLASSSDTSLLVSKAHAVVPQAMAV